MIDVIAQSSQLPAELNLYLAIDQSNSMWDTNDPDARRIDAVEALIDTLGALSGLKTRASVVFFGNRAEVVAQSKPLDSAQGRAALKSLIRQKHTELGPMGWTDIVAAWNTIFSIVKQEHSAAAKSAIVVLTDGLPATETANPYVESSESAVAQYQEDVKRAFQSFRNFDYAGDVCAHSDGGSGVPLYVVGVREGAEGAVQQGTAQSRYVNIWQELANDSAGYYYRSSEDVGSLPDMMLRMAADVTCLPVPVAAEERRLAPGETLEYAVPALDVVEGVVVAMVKDDPLAALDLSIVQPDGVTRAVDDLSIVRNSSPGDEVISIQRREGWEGDWTLRVANVGNREAGLRFRLIPVALSLDVRFEEPAESIYPRGKELPIRLRVTDKEGHTILDILEDVAIEVRSPASGSTKALDFDRQSDALVAAYHDTLILDQRDNGDRDIVFKAKLRLGGQTLPLQASKPVALNPWPYLSVLAPTVGHNYARNQAIPLAVQILVEDGPDAATAQTASVTATVCCDGAGQPVWQGELTFDPAQGPSVFSGVIAAETLGEGEYIIAYTLQGGTAPRPDRAQRALTIGTPLLPSPTPTPTVTPTPLPTPTPAPPPPPWSERFAAFLDRLAWLWMPLAGLVGLLVVVGVWRSIAGMPALDGMVMTLSSPGSEIEEFLRGGRFGAYKLNVGQDDVGLPAAQLSVRPHKTRDQGIIARVNVQRLGNNVDAVRVGTSAGSGHEYRVREDFYWFDGEHIFAGDGQATLKNPNQVKAFF
jgi:hypothetical protein